VNPLRPGRFCPWVFPAGLQRCRLLRRPATLRLRGVAVAERSPRWLPSRERPPVHFVVVAASVATSRLALASTIAGADGFGKLPAKNSLPPTASHECTLGTRKESSQGQLHRRLRLLPMKASLGQLVVLTPCGGVQAPGWRALCPQRGGPSHPQQPRKAEIPQPGPVQRSPPFPRAQPRDVPPRYSLSHALRWPEVDGCDGCDF
jgi:hypothetical protein